MEDKAQTLKIPDIHTTANDSETGDNVGTVSEDAGIIDTVYYTNQKRGEVFVLVAKLGDSETGEIIKDADGEDLTVEKRFVCWKEEGSIEMLAFEIDSTQYAGESVVVLEELYWVDEEHDNEEVLMTVHESFDDTEHLHCHYVINSVSFVDGKRLQGEEKAWFKFRHIADEICQKHGLSVVQDPERNRDPYENGTPIEHGKIREMFNNLIKENDLRPVVFHSLRHSSTTYKLKISGGDIKAAQGDIGHSEAAMITERYAHILDDDRRINAEKFEEMFYQQKSDAGSGSKAEELLSIMKKLQESPELLELLKGLMK